MLKFDGLTDRQNQILTTMIIYMARRQNKPTMRSIGKMVGIKSISGVDGHLKALERKGYLELIAGFSNDFYQLGRRVPQNMIVNIDSTICILNPKWKMTREDAAALAKKLSEFTFVGSPDITGKLDVDMGSVGKSRRALRKGRRIFARRSLLATFVPPTAELLDALPHPCSHPLYELPSSD
jgi:hypothetical protein